MAYIDIESNNINDNMLFKIDKNIVQTHDIQNHSPKYMFEAEYRNLINEKKENRNTSSEPVTPVNSPIELTRFRLSQEEVDFEIDKLKIGILNFKF